MEDFNFHGTKEAFEAEMYRRGYTVTNTPNSVILQKRLIWSSEKPTEPGWYWVDHIDDGIGMDQFDQFDIEHMKGLENHYRRYAGPIPEPTDAE